MTIMIMTMMTISQKYHHHHHHHQHQNDNDLHITTRGRGCWRASVWEVWQPLPTPGAIWGNHLNHPIICNSYKHYLNIFLYQNQSFVQLEETLAALEGSEHCLTFGSGSKPAASQNICCFSKHPPHFHCIVFSCLSVGLSMMFCSRYGSHLCSSGYPSAR